MKNKLSDLNDYLFEQIENLCDEDLTGEKLEAAIIKADKIADISKVIIQNQALQLNAIKTAYDCGVQIKTDSMQKLLGSSNGEKIQ